MKHSIFLKLTTLALFSVIAVTGCKNTPKNVTPIPGARTSVAPPPGGNPLTNAPGTTGPLEAIGTGIIPGPGTPVKTGVIGDPVVPPPLTGQGTQPGGGNAGDLRDFEGRPMDRAAFAANTVHFDYDKAIVKATEVGKLQPVVAALKASPQNMLLIEGHCDERGTEEYNRSLGERRALAIRERLVKAGISPDRLRTISYGEDKPIELGHTEAAWAKNRRGELVLLKPKN